MAASVEGSIPCSNQFAVFMNELDDSEKHDVPPQVEESVPVALPTHVNQPARCVK